jgi:hypothetical protein
MAGSLLHHGHEQASSEGPVVMMALVEALVVLSIVAVIAYATYIVISGGGQRRSAVARAGARWEATHYAVRDATRVVVRKIVPGTGEVLDEHMIAEIPDSDSDYDTRFLEAMAEARARVALFESESD